MSAVEHHSYIADIAAARRQGAEEAQLPFRPALAELHEAVTLYLLSPPGTETKDGLRKAMARVNSDVGEMLGELEQQDTAIRALKTPDRSE